MGHYAKVQDGIVVQVIVADQEFIDSYKDPMPGTWVKTSYNTRGNVHYGPDGQPDNGIVLRGNYAGVGFTYDSVHDVFYPQQPFLSWHISAQTNWLWEAPVPYPNDGKLYVWDESTQQWVETAQ